MKDIWKRLSIRYKITSIVVLIILMITVTVLPVVSYLIKDTLLMQQQEHLVSVRNLVVKLFDDYKSKVAGYAELFSNDREIKDTLFYHTELAGEREHPLRAAMRLYKSFTLDSVEIGDNKGRVIAAAENHERYGYNRSNDMLIKNAFHRKISTGIELSEGGFVIRASAPVYYNENQIIGTITAGISLDSRLLSKIKELSNTDIVLMDNNKRIISSTLEPDNQMYSEDRLLLEFPLSDVSSSAIGRVVIVQKNKLPQIIARVQITLFILLLVIAAISIFILSITLRRLTQPIIKLKEGAELIGNGAFEHRIDVASQDEVGELSESFNRMAQNLKKLHSMEESLRQSERLAAVGKFAAGIAHEINNPIGNIMGIAKLTQRSISDDLIRADLETIIKDANRCARIVKDLLTYSRQSLPKKEKTALNSIVEDAVNSLRNKLDSKNIEIKKEFYNNLPDVFIDPLQINQVLTNVLLNAVQSIETSGIVTVKTTQDENSMVEISISDTGCGIDEDIQDKIFYPFFTTKAVGEGTGLGLAISYGIIQNHGGEILVESKKGYGSVFRIRLPAGEDNG
ncbi:MAG: ATP-binding protein [Nitrospirota bacterium]